MFKHVALIVTIFQGIQAKKTQKILKTAIEMVKVSWFDPPQSKWVSHALMASEGQQSKM